MDIYQSPFVRINCKPLAPILLVDNFSTLVFLGMILLRAHDHPWL